MVDFLDTLKGSDKGNEGKASCDSDVKDKKHNEPETTKKLERRNSVKKFVRKLSSCNLEVKDKTHNEIEKTKTLERRNSQKKFVRKQSKTKILQKSKKENN